MKNWSPARVFSIITVLIGARVFSYRCSHQGPEMTLITANTEGIESGKTTIKNRSVDVGMVRSATLADDLTRVETRARLNSGTEELLHKGTVFRVVKPQIGREGISGLGTLLSGVYTELQPGAKDGKMDKYDLLDSPPLALPDAKGIRVLLNNKKAGQPSPRDPVPFRNYWIGLVEASTFDTQKRNISHQLFINAPYDRLVTSDVRFWKDSDITADLALTEMRVEMGSSTTLLSSDISLDMLESLDLGRPVAPKTAFVSYNNQKSIQNSLYTDHTDYLMLFKDPVRDLQPGTPVRSRGIRLGTVSKVPFFVLNMRQTFNDDHRIPVLIRIEPKRLKMQLDENTDAVEHLDELLKRGLRGSLKTGDLVTGTLYTDLDFCLNTPAITGIREFDGYQITPTASGGLVQVQQRPMEALGKINKLPPNPMTEQAASTLFESQRTMKNLQTTLGSMNKTLANQSMQQLPTGTQLALRKLNHGMQDFQPSSAVYSKVVADMQRFDQVLREL